MNLKQSKNFLDFEKYYKYGTKRIEKEEYIADNISKAIFDERPIRVTMEEMIAAGYFQANIIFIRRNSDNPI